MVETTDLDAAFDEFFGEDDTPEPTCPPTRQYGQVPGKTLARKVREGLLDPKTLGREERRQCVLYLDSVGMAKLKIAAILEITYDTVVNDLRALGDQLIQANAFDLPSILGWVFRVADETAAQAKRIALKAERDKEYGKAARSLWACWKTVKEYTTTLQSMGVLEKAPDKTVVQIEVRAQVQQIFAAVVQVVSAEIGDPDVREKIQNAVAERLAGLVAGSLPPRGTGGSETPGA